MLNISQRNGEMFQFQALPTKAKSKCQCSKIKSRKIKILEYMLENGAYVTLNQLAIALTGRIFLHITRSHG